jgi:hypothetical protein
VTASALAPARPDRVSAKAAPLSVTVAGTGIGTSTDAQGRFTLSGVPSGTIQLQFSGGGVNATLTISGVTATDAIDIVVSLTGNNARVESEQRRQAPPTETPNNQNPNRVTVNGRIASLNAVARTFVADGTTVSVPLTATIRHGSRDLLFTDLTVGAHVEVKGTWSGTLFVATEVKAQQLGPTVPDDADEDEDAGDAGDDEEDQDDSANEHGQARLSGAVSGKTGTCPAISFTVQGTTVTTDGDTRFRRVTCAALTAGASVDVMGTRLSNGSVLAKSVELDN